MTLVDKWVYSSEPASWQSWKYWITSMRCSVCASPHTSDSHSVTSWHDLHQLAAGLQHEICCGWQQLFTKHISAFIVNWDFTQYWESLFFKMVNIVFVCAYQCSSETYSDKFYGLAVYMFIMHGRPFIWFPGWRKVISAQVCEEDVLLALIMTWTPVSAVSLLSPPACRLLTAKHVWIKQNQREGL